MTFGGGCTAAVAAGHVIPHLTASACLAMLLLLMLFCFCCCGLRGALLNKACPFPCVLLLMLLLMEA